MKFYLETYGCSLNAADSDIIVGRLHTIGGERVGNPEEADVILLNTCGVKEPTEDRIISRLKDLSDSEQPVVVTGCLPLISLNRVKRSIPEFAALLGPQAIETLGTVLNRIMLGERGIIHLEPDKSSKLGFYEGPPASVICTIPICEGCLGNCAYCAVRFARGDVKSYEIQAIREIVERCIHLGYREIRLTSQDAGAFGHDTNESLVSLLESLGEIDGSHKFRLGMFNPNLVIDSLPEILAAMTSEHYFKFFHIPLQSGSNRILKLMQRHYSVESWKSMITTIRQAFPQATIMTDIIIGFPGETDQDFIETMDTLQDAKPTVVNISKYGDRPGTEASKSAEKVHSLMKKNRSRKVTKLTADLSKTANESWVGLSEKVLVTGPAPKGGTLCRNSAYRSVIVLEPLEPGIYVDVEIVSAEKTHLLGKLMFHD